MPHPVMLKGILGSTLRNYSLVELGDDRRCRGLNQGQPCTRPAFNPLYYDSSPDSGIVKMKVLWVAQLFPQAAKVSSIKNSSDQLKPPGRLSHGKHLSSPAQEMVTECSKELARFQRTIRWQGWELYPICGAPKALALCWAPKLHPSGKFPDQC